MAHILTAYERNENHHFPAGDGRVIIFAYLHITNWFMIRISMFRIFCAEVRTQFPLISGYPHNFTDLISHHKTQKIYESAT
jgi:hypothetical protein